MKRIARWSLWAACGLMVLLAALHFLLPVWFNSDAFKTRLLGVVEKAVPGTVDFDRLRPTLLPLPGVDVTKVRWHHDDRYRLQAERISVTLGLLPLFKGRIAVDVVRIVSPDVSLQLTTGASSKNVDDKPLKRETFTEIGGLLTKIPEETDLFIDNGRLVITIGDETVERWEAICAHIATADGRLQAEMDAVSSLAGAVQLSARIDKKTLDGRAQIDFLKMPVANWHGLLPASAPSSEGLVDLHLGIETNGLQTYKADFQLTAPNISLAREKRQMKLSKLLAAGSARWSQDALVIRLDRLAVASPRLNGSVAISRRNHARPDEPPIRLTVRSKDSDATGFRELFLFLVDGADHWDLWDIVRGGTLNEMTLELAGPAWSSIGLLENMKLTGKAMAARIFVPGPDLDLTEVDGRFTLSDGRLSVLATHAAIGSSTAHRAKLTLDLAGSPLKMDLAVDLDADLAQLPAILKRSVESPGLSAELDRIQQLEGRAQGELVVTGPLNKLAVDATVNNIMASASYDRLPLPVQVRKGRLQLTGDKFVFERGLVTMADNRFDGLSGRVNFAKKQWAVIDCETVRIACRQVYPWLRSQSLFSRWAQDIEDVDGLLLFKDVRVSNETLAADGWQARGRGDFNEVTLQSEVLPGALAINGGRFQFDADNYSIADLQMRMADSAVYGNIAIKDFRTKGRSIGLSASGTLGRHGIQWLNRLFDLSLDSVSGPVTVGNVSLDWQLQGESWSGSLSIDDLNIIKTAWGPFAVKHADIKADHGLIEVETMAFEWRRQPLNLSGKIDLAGGKEASLDLMLKADALDLSPPERTKNSVSHSDGEKSRTDFSRISGNIGLQVGTLAYGRHRWAGVRANVLLREDGFRVEVTEADLCGIATRGSIQWTPGGVTLTLAPSAARQAIQFTGGCLTGADTTERISGTFDVGGTITTSGQTGAQILQNLNGAISFKAVDGVITNAGSVGVFTNILSHLHVRRLFENKSVDLRKDDLAYETIVMQIRVDKGVARFTDAQLTCEALNMVAEGTVDLETSQTRLTVLVSPLTSVDSVIKRIPIVGKILEGTLVAIPVEVKGPLANPSVVPLSPKAIGSRLTGILERTLKAPFQLVEFERSPAGRQGNATTPDDNANENIK